MRWHSRFCREVRGVTLAESQLLLAALVALSPAASTLAELCERYGLSDAARVAARWAGIG